MREERLLLCQMLMPYVSDAEQAEIEAELSAFSDVENWVDMTDWVKYGNQIPQISS
jgi:hypothetical protein